MLPTRSLTDLAAALSPDHLLDAAQAIERWRTPRHEEALGRWFGFDPPGAWTTPFMLRAGLAAAARGLVAFDRLERVVLPAHTSWVHPDLGPAGYGSALGPETLHAPPLWPFAQDALPADFQTQKLAPKWLSHSLVHTLVGFGHWPELTEWELMGMARLSEAMASFHWYWLAELGRLDERGLELNLPNLERSDTALYLLLEQQAADPATRLARLQADASRHIADNALEILHYEIYAYRQLFHEGDLVEPTDLYIDFGEAAEYAKTHHRRLTSPSFARFLEHAMVAGEDYATSPDQFEARAAQALAAVLDESPVDATAFDGRRRAIRTLQDAVQRLCHADLLTPHPETPAALRTLADAIARARAADPTTASNPANDPVASAVSDAAAALTEAMARLGVDPTPKSFFGATSFQPAAFALGYSTTPEPALEPAPLTEVRALAFVRRAYALHSAAGAALEGMLPVVRRALRQTPRRGNLIDPLMAVAEDAARNEEVPWLAYAYIGWLQVALSAWGESDPASHSRRWHYRAARRHLPESAETFAEYEVAWNPYLKRYPLPFDSKWNDELARTRPGEAKVFKGKNTTSVWYAYIGPGRERPVYLPLVPRLNSLIFHLKSPRRLDALVANPDYGLEFMRQAIEDEAVLLFHKPRIDRPERALDIFEVAIEASAGLDHGLDPYGPWDEEAQAEAYLKFCERSGHYRESSAALLDVLALPADARLGELGFGTGETTREILARLGPDGRYVGVDPAPRMLNHMQAITTDDRTSFRIGGARALAWAAAFEGGFSHLVAHACIWLANDLPEALTNLWRAALPGGRLALSIPAEYLGFIEHLQTESSLAVQSAILETRQALGLSAPGTRTQSSNPGEPPVAASTEGPAAHLGDVDRFRMTLMEAGWRDVELTRWSRPWPTSEYLDWLSLPVVAEGLVGDDDKARAQELIEGVRARVNPASPLNAVWYFVLATRPADD